MTAHIKCKLCGESNAKKINMGVCPDCWKVLDCQCGLEKL